MNDRLHFADNLRAVAMLLGICLHAAVSFTVYPGAWPIKDVSAHVGFDLFVVFVHSFRLPTFFLITGFFARLLYRRIGPAAFVRHRAKRILVPLLVGMVTIVPLVQAVGIYGATAAAPGGAPLDRLKAVAGYFIYGGYFRNLHPAHLWFLYYLLYFYALAVLLAPLSGRAWGQRTLRAADAFLGRLAGSWWKPLALAVFTLPTLYLMRTFNSDSPSGFLLEAKILAFYGVFFCFGWLLHRQPALLPDFGRGAWLYLAAGALAAFPVYIKLLWQAGAPGPLAKLLTLSSYALTVWLLTLGMLGIFIRYFDRPRARVRYVADSSYWLYLIHYPLVSYLQVLFAGLPLPSAVKYLLILAVSVPLLLASYHFGVRYTWVGEFLNGKVRREAGSAGAAGPAGEPATQPTC